MAADREEINRIIFDELVYGQITPDALACFQGVIGRLRSCEDGWCEVEIAGKGGWLPRDAFWGAYPAEAVE